MKRMVMGAVAGLAVWFGSALAAEAQQITPTGPLNISAGATSATFTGTVSLPYASYFYIKINVLQNGQNIHTSNTFVPNPGTTIYNFSKLCSFSVSAQGGATITFQSCVVFAGKPYQAPDWNVVVQGTRPSSKSTSAKGNNAMALQTVDRDRRRE